MPKYTQKMWEQWKDYRLDEAPNMFKGAKKSAQKDIDSLDKNFKMMIKEADKGGDRKRAMTLMKAYKKYIIELKLVIKKA
jgi:hypothetical protein|tara:strand:- start:493 stop:732 length:240 start_codon:yes stop_codon:yes gene_type:complete